MQIKAEFAIIKNNPIIKRYLELQSIASQEHLSDSMIISFSFSDIETSNIPEKQKIYIYTKAYKINNSYDSRSDYLLDDEDWKIADYLLYTNIDSDFDGISIEPKYRERFKKIYTVLSFSNTLNIKRKYFNLQQFYFSQLLNIDLRKKSSVLTLLKEKIK